MGLCLILEMSVTSTEQKTTARRTEVNQQMNQTRMNQSTSTSNTQNIHTNLFFNPINQIDLTIIII